MKENNNKSIIILLIIIIVVMAIITTLALTDTINLKNNPQSNNLTENKEEIKENTEIYSSENIKGTYSYKSEMITDEYENNFHASYNLTLYENGTFEYRLATIYPFGYIGNYIIKDNQIILNYLFETNSSTGINVTNGTHTITINNDNTLSDTNQPITNINLTTITLTKDETIKLNYDDIYNKINNYTITNNSDNIIK